MAAYLYLASVCLHILAAMAWIGGMAFLALVVVPIVRRQQDQAGAGRLIHESGVRFRAVAWTCLGLLVATGAANTYFRAGTWQGLTSGAFWGSSFGHTLCVKLVVVLGILVLSGLHDFHVGPRATAAWQEDPTSAASRDLRRLAGSMGRITMLLSLLVLVLAVVLVRGSL